jgi:NTE family protein
MQIRQKKVGLALGGGVARGLAHVGVLKVLVEAGIPIDYVAASSAGTVVGASFCAGASPEKIKEYAFSLRWWDFARPTWPRRGLVSFRGLRLWLEARLGPVRFEDLAVPFAVVATDMDTGGPVYLCQGPLSPAVQASCSIPGLVEPVHLEGRWLGDGSLVDSVPVQILRQMGAEYIIGVDIFTVSPRRHLGPLGALFCAVEIMVERAGGGISRADCLINPALGGATYLHFSKREDFFRLGEQAAREKLPEIRAAILD